MEKATAQHLVKTRHFRINDELDTALVKMCIKESTTPSLLIRQLLRAAAAAALASGTIEEVQHEPSK